VRKYAQYCKKLRSMQPVLSGYSPDANIADLKSENQ
jgi:hypothetical protein